MSERKKIKIKKDQNKKQKEKTRQVFLNREGIVAREKARSDGYRLLAACFYRPQKILLEEKVFENLEAAFHVTCKEAVDYASSLRTSFIKEGEKSLLVDYARLFVGPYELLAPPYGSVYLEKKRMVMGDSTMAVKKDYAAMGLEVDKDFPDLPDHVAVELEFMYFLVYEELNAYARGDVEKIRSILEQQKKFLSDHLGAWILDFAKKIQQSCATSFYKNLAQCTSLFVQGEKHYLAKEWDKLIESLSCK